MRENRPKILPKILSEDQISRLMNAPDTSTLSGLRDRAILETLYASGLRVSELASLNLDQVNKGQMSLFVTGKGGKERQVLIGKTARAALDAYLKIRPENNADALFINRFGGRLSARSIRALVGKHGNQALGKRVWPHMLRHSFATHLLDSGIMNIRQLQELLGHADVSTTCVYTHVSIERLRKSVSAHHPLAQKIQTRRKP